MTFTATVAEVLKNTDKGDTHRLKQIHVVSVMLACCVWVTEAERMNQQLLIIILVMFSVASFPVAASLSCRFFL